MLRPFFQRFGTHGICVLPSDVLSNDLLRVDPETHTIPRTLRKQASASDVCYARVLRSFADGLYWAEVAPAPDLVDAQRVVLTEEHLYHALPWDIRLQDREADMIRGLMFAHAQTVQPARRQVTPDQRETFPSQNEPHLDDGTVRPQPQEQDETMTLIALPEVFISTQTISETIAEEPEPPFARSAGRLKRWTRLAWLHAALSMVRRQMRHACQAFAKLDILLEKVIATQGHVRQSLVSASAVYIGERLVGWRLQIALPMREVLA